MLITPWFLIENLLQILHNIFIKKSFGKETTIIKINSDWVLYKKLAYLNALKTKNVLYYK